MVGYRALVRSRARDWSRKVAPLHVFGGRPLLDAPLPRSRVTRAPLHLALDLDLSDPRLADLGVTSVRRLAVLAAYGVDPPAGTPLFVRHHDGGRRLEILSEPDGVPASGLPSELPQLPVDLEELTEAEAACELVEDYPEGHGPLHQVGGRPVWHVAAPPVPTCPLSGRPMRYVATIDSERRFPLGDGDAQLLFGDGGSLYVFWSDEPAVSAAFVEGG